MVVGYGLIMCHCLARTTFAYKHRTTLGTNVDSTIERLALSLVPDWILQHGRQNLLCGFAYVLATVPVCAKSLGSLSLLKTWTRQSNGLPYPW